MKLYIKEKVFTWGDQFTVKDAAGVDRYTVEGEVFTWGKKLHVYDRSGREVAFIRQKITFWMPTYILEVNGREVATIRREFTWFQPKYTVEGQNWQVQGHFWEHDYEICDGSRQVAAITKEWMTWGDSYQLDIADPADELMALAVVLTIDCVTEQDNNNG